MTGHNDSSSMMASGSMNTMLNCYGDPIPERQGNWYGHVFPGTIFLIWATHWLISASWRYISAQRTGRPYQARSTEGLLPMLSGLQGFNRYPVESILKAVGGLLLFILQVTYGGYKLLVCTDGVREGRFATQHINSWAHAAMNLGFSLSGFVELAGFHVKLPQGTKLAVLSGGFFIEGLLFDMHEKNGHLDQTVHWLLAQACFACAVFAMLEAAFPQNFLLTMGRVTALLLQGTWFCQTAVVLFAGDSYWDDNFDSHEDEAPAMFLPVIFTFHLLLVTAFVVTGYAGVEYVYKRMSPASSDAGGSPSFGGFETSRLLSDDEGRDGKAVAMASLRRV